MYVAFLIYCSFLSYCLQLVSYSYFITDCLFIFSELEFFFFSSFWLVLVWYWHWWQGLWQFYSIKDFNIIKTFLKEKRLWYRDIYCYRDIKLVISWYKILVISPTPKYGRPEFESRLEDLSRSRPPSLSLSLPLCFLSALHCPIIILKKKQLRDHYYHYFLRHKIFSSCVCRTDFYANFFVFVSISVVLLQSFSVSSVVQVLILPMFVLLKHDNQCVLLSNFHSSHHQTTLL